MAEGDYEVGFGKPPKWRRFRPGQSGNPKGRPKGAHNLASSIRKVAGRKVKVKERDGDRLISKHEAIMTQIVNKAANGDLKAVAQYIKIVENLPEEPIEHTLTQVIVEFV